MYVLIYDCEDCLGIEETFDTWEEMQQARKELKECGYYNFSHAYIGEY